MPSSNEMVAANALLTWSKSGNSAYNKPSPISVNPKSETGSNKIWNNWKQEWFTPLTIRPNPTKHMGTPIQRKNRKSRKSRKSKKTRKANRK